MNAEDIESVYDAIAKNIDAVGTENSELFLAKLSLLLAKATGDRDLVLKCISQANTTSNDTKSC